MEKTPKAKKPIYKRIWFWIVVVVLVVGIGSALGGGGKDKDGNDNTKASSSKIKTAESKKETATPVSFEEMNKDYVANGAAADDKYKGKLLEFQGKVSSVAANPIKGTDVTIEAGNFTDNQFQDTKAKVNVDDEMAKKLTSGQTYTFQAKGDGVMMSDGWVMYLNFSNGIVK